jgi:hypothetical protein
VNWLEAHGYARPTVVRRVPLLFHFGDFAQKNDCRDIASAAIFVEAFVSQWLRQNGAEAKTPESLRKHRIFAEMTLYGFEKERIVNKLPEVSGGHRPVETAPFPGSFLDDERPQDILAVDPDRVIAAAKNEMDGLQHG